VILSIFLSQLGGTAVLYPVMGAGALCISVGVGLMVAARSVERHRHDREREAAGPQEARLQGTLGH